MLGVGKGFSPIAKVPHPREICTDLTSGATPAGAESFVPSKAPETAVYTVQFVSDFAQVKPFGLNGVRKSNRGLDAERASRRC